MRKVMVPVPDGPNNKDHLWKKGESGNPAGRKRGCRNRLSEAFLTDLLADWEAHGAATLVIFRTERPHEYVKVMAALVPKEFSLKVNPLDDLTDEQLDAQLRAVLHELRAAGMDLGLGDEAAEGQEPAGPVPPLH